MRNPAESFHSPWNDSNNRSTRCMERGTSGTVQQSNVQESRTTPSFLAVPRGGTMALERDLQTLSRVPFRSTPFPRGPRGTLALLAEPDAKSVPNWRVQL
jgi:hypothetical protein